MHLDNLRSLHVALKGWIPLDGGHGVHRDVRSDAVTRHRNRRLARHQHVLSEEGGFVFDLVCQAE